MNRLKPPLKFCLAAAILVLVSLGLFILSQARRGVNPLRLFAGSPLRLLVGMALGLLVVVFLGLFLALWNRPAYSDRLDRFFNHQLQKRWLRDSLIFIALALIFTVLLTLIETWILGGTPLLLRYSPLLFLLFAFPALVISTDYFEDVRPKLLSIFAFAVLFCAIGILIQGFFVRQLTDQVSLNPLESLAIAFLLSTLATALAFRFHSASLAERKLLILLLAMVTGLFFIEWLVWPRKLRSGLEILAITSPLLIYALPLLAAAIIAAWQKIKQLNPARVEIFAKALTMCGLLFLAFLYIQSDLRHARLINTSPSFSDEGNYMAMIKDARRLNFNYTGDQNRMPGYVFLQALFYTPSMSDLALFDRGKLINILLSVLLLALLYLLFLHYFSFFQSTLLLLLVAFSLFIYKAPYIQSEITFYFLAFASFILFLQMLARPTWPVALAAGLVTGLAYLTKASALLGLYIFVGVFLLKIFVSGFQGWRHKTQSNLRALLTQLLYLGLLLALFAGVIFPYAYTLKQRFGHYFYNVNTTFFMWLDDWDQAVAMENQYHVGQAWPAALPPDQLPGLRNYLHTHSAAQILERIRVGVLSEMINIYGQFGLLNSQLAYLWIFILGVLINLPNAIQTLKKYPYLALFVLLYFAVYLASFAWYTPISSGRRFTYGLYIPFMFSIFASLNALARNQVQQSGLHRDEISLSRYFDLSSILIAILLILEIWLALTTLLFLDRFGS